MVRKSGKPDLRRRICANPPYGGYGGWSRGGFHLLERGKIVGDPALQIELRLIAQLLARSRYVIDAGCRIGEAVEVQAAADFHLRVRNVLFDHALEVAQRHADTGPDVVDPALDPVGERREIDAERRVLVIDEVILVVAALFELEGG